MRAIAFALLASACISEPPRPACSSFRRLDELNKPDHDRDPWLSPDRTEIFFSSTRPGSAAGYQVWRAVRDSYEGPFGEPTQITGELVSDGDVRGPTLSDDGLTLYYAKEPAGGGLPAIYAATRADRVTTYFTSPVKLVDEGSHPSLTANGLVMYLHKWNTADLFRTTRVSLAAPFAPPSRIDELAGTLNEFDPSISGDDTTLLYALDVSGAPIHIVRSHHGTVFSPPEPVVEAQLPDPAANMVSPMLHRDGVTILFASDITGGSALTDLFITCE